MKRKIEETKPSNRIYSFIKFFFPFFFFFPLLTFLCKNSNLLFKGENATLLAQFYTTDGEPTGSKMALPCDITVDQLHTLLNDHILKNVCVLFFYLN